MLLVKNITIGMKNKNYKIAAIDFGIKFNILRQLENENCYIKVFLEQ